MYCVGHDSWCLFSLFHPFMKVFFKCWFTNILIVYTYIFDELGSLRILLDECVYSAFLAIFLWIKQIALRETLSHRIGSGRWITLLSPSYVL